MFQSGLYILRRIFLIIVGIHLREYLVHDIGINLLHALHIFHMIRAARRIGLQFMLMCKCRLT